MRQNNLIAKKKSTLATVYMLPPFLKLLLAFGLFVFLILVGFFYFHQESSTNVTKINRQRESLERDITQQASLYGELFYLSKHIDSAKNEYQRMLNYFPPESSVGELLSDITKLGTEEGLKFIHFKPKASIAHTFYAELPVEVAVTGHFHQIGRLLSGIANLPRSVVVINDFSLTQQNPKENLLLLEFTATIYYSLPNVADIKT